MKGKKKEVTTISQRAAQIVEGAHTKEKEDVACPRCDRELYVFNTASGPILRCRGWTLAGTPCTLIKACHNGVIVPGGLQNTNRTEGGNSASGSGGPGALPRRDDGVPNPPLLNDWIAQAQALAANPAWAHEQFTQWQLLHQQYQHLQYQQQLVAASTTDPWQVLPEDDGSTGDRHGNGSDWCVIAQSNTTSEPESVNHQQDGSGNARSNGKKKDEPVLTASLVLQEHPFEIKQENEVPELSAAIRERGIWSRHCSLAVFWSPSSARDRSCEFNVLGQDTLLGGAIERVKLDDGSYLNVLDDSDLADFIHHHAWFEGDEVALPREDRVYLLGNLTGQTPKKRRVTQSRSDLKVLNATCSFPIETEQHELDADCNGADEMVTDETPFDDENGGDSETIVQKPLTSSQKKVIRNIHNNCGHPSKEEFLRALRLSRARPEVLTMCDECSSVQHVQPKVILQNPDFQQRCRGLFASTKHLVSTFLRSSLQTVPKLFSATWCVGARCTNCVFLLWTRLLRLWQSVLQSGGSSILVLRW